MGASPHSGFARRGPTRSPAIRILTAVPICDGHDSAILTINLELIRRGIEVIYLGYHRSVSDIVRAAIQEDVHAIGLSSYNGGHVEFFNDVLATLKRKGARNIGLFGGGGATISLADAKQMQRRGVERIFFAGTPLAEIAEWVKKTYARQSRRPTAPLKGNGVLSHSCLAKLLSSVETSVPAPAFSPGPSAPVVGLTGPGGVGKTTLMDELVLRFLQTHPRGRIAILSHDPSPNRSGALLGDRATMVYAQDDRVFMRSLATRGKAGGISSATRRCLAILRHSGFELVLLETTGIGQQDLPFGGSLVDTEVLVLSPDYGARLQLQKIAMLEAADLVVVNKSDLAGAKTAAAELAHRLAANKRAQRVITTVAKRHRDPGVDALFKEIMA